MILNFAILKHPANWLTVVLMVLIAGIAAHFILEYANMMSAKPSTK